MSSIESFYLDTYNQRFGDISIYAYKVGKEYVSLIILRIEVGELERIDVI